MSVLFLVFFLLAAPSLASNNATSAPTSAPLYDDYGVIIHAIHPSFDCPWMPDCSHYDDAVNAKIQTAVDSLSTTRRNLRSLTGNDPTCSELCKYVPRGWCYKAYPIGRCRGWRRKLGTSVHTKSQQCANRQNLVKNELVLFGESLAQDDICRPYFFQNFTLNCLYTNE